MVTTYPKENSFVEVRYYHEKKNFDQFANCIYKDGHFWVSDDGSTTDLWQFITDKYVLGWSYL